MEVFLGIIGFVWGILCIILFFKVWGMCNNVSKLLTLLENRGKDDKEPQQSTKVRHDESRQKKVHQDVQIQTRINPWK
jgi:hypothetical protein